MIETNKKEIEEEKELKFNISASSINLYYTSPLEFYYEYILKDESDTICPDIYGLGGNLVHSFIEKYGKELKKNNNFQIDEKVKNDFKNEWKKLELDKKVGINNKKLNFDIYYNSFLLGLNKLKYKYMLHYNKILFEDLFLIPFYKDNKKKIEINYKGYTDLICQNSVTNEIILIDWKTSSSIDVSNESFIRQGKMYFLLYYLKYKKIPQKIIFEYLKLNRHKEYNFNLNEILKFKNEIEKIIYEIINIKKHNKKMYSLGNFEKDIFNRHKKKCIEEKEIRNSSSNEININIFIKNNYIYFSDDNENKNKFMNSQFLYILIDKKYSYYVDGYIWSKKYLKGQWDGKKHLFNLKKKCLPLGFIVDLEQYVNEINTYYKKNYKLNIIKDYRENVSQIKTISYKNNINKKLRDYQIKSIDAVIEKKIGIINLATGLGKSFLACELIKKINIPTLFVVNRIELVHQTVQMFDEDLCNIFDIGIISEGSLNLKQINICSIQTLYSILSRSESDENKKTLIKYLKSVGMTIWDECHDVSNSSYYSMLLKYVINCHYFIGLSATDYRNDGATLEMNSVVGRTIISYNTEFGEKNNYLCPTKIYFIESNLDYYKGNFFEKYDNLIVKNRERNNQIKLICEKNSNKKIIIIVKKIEHGEILESLISDSFLVNSHTNIKQRKLIMYNFLHNVEGFRCLIMGIKIGGVGLNIPDLDIIINASAHKSNIDTIQIIGRAKRKYEGKEYGYYIDFKDSGYFHKNYTIRRKMLESKGNTDITVINNINEIM